jgi:3-dehydroquinate synthetase
MTIPSHRLVSANRERSYCVRLLPQLCSGEIAELVRIIGGRKSLFVSTPTVARLYANTITNRLRESGVDISLAILQCTEQSKTIIEVEALCQKCFGSGLDRRSLLIGCGGGVCTDLVTMAAALTRRGLNYLRIPTTLIGLIDAGIGVKGAVNLPTKKSAMGVFYPPEQVLLDPEFLRTLPTGPLSDGLAEAIKIAVVLDPKLFEFLERFSGDLLKSPANANSNDLIELVWQSTLGLLGELETNVYEDKTYRRVLDFGHTFSPFIESTSDFRVTHGVAVGLDIALSTAVAFELDLLSREDRDRILASLHGARLPVYSPLLTEVNCLQSLEEIEAHRGGHLNLVVPSGIGRSRFITERRSVSSQLLKSAITSLDLAARRRLFVAVVGFGDAGHGALELEHHACRKKVPSKSGVGIV